MIVMNLYCYYDLLNGPRRFQAYAEFLAQTNMGLAHSRSPL